MLDVSNVNSLFTHIYVGTKEMSLLYRNLKKKMSEDLENSLRGAVKAVHRELMRK